MYCLYVAPVGRCPGNDLTVNEGPPTHLHFTSSDPGADGFVCLSPSSAPRHPSRVERSTPPGAGSFLCTSLMLDSSMSRSSRDSEAMTQPSTQTGTINNVVPTVTLSGPMPDGQRGTSHRQFPSSVGADTCDWRTGARPRTQVGADTFDTVTGGEFRLPLARSGFFDCQRTVATATPLPTPTADGTCPNDLLDGDAVGRMMFGQGGTSYTYRSRPPIGSDTFVLGPDCGLTHPGPATRSTTPPAREFVCPPMVALTIAGCGRDSDGHPTRHKGRDGSMSLRRSS